MHTIKMRAALAALALLAVGAPAAAVVSPLARAGAGDAGAPRPTEPSGARGASAHEVVLKGLRFHPNTITIDPGESVTWVWRDGGIDHNVTAPGFHSRTQAHGTFTVRFTHAGTFDYRCTIHEGMVGRVVVR
jgi:plastocyanin